MKVVGATFKGPKDNLCESKNLVEFDNTVQPTLFVCKNYKFKKSGYECIKFLVLERKEIGPVNVYIDFEYMFCLPNYMGLLFFIISLYICI